MCNYYNSDISYPVLSDSVSKNYFEPLEKYVYIIVTLKWILYQYIFKFRESNIESHCSMLLYMKQ